MYISIHGQTGDFVPRRPLLCIFALYGEDPHIDNYNGYFVLIWRRFEYEIANACNRAEQKVTKPALVQNTLRIGNFGL